MPSLSTRSLLMTTALALCVTAPTAVFAQSQPPSHVQSQAQAPAQARPAPAQPGPQTPPQEAPAEDEETELEDVVVRTTRPDIVASADRMSYNVANDLQAQTGSVADMLRNVPGVEVDLQGNVSLRGDSNVTIMIDGRPSAMMRGESRADVLQAMSAGQIERVEVITNPSAAFSPEGGGGVINLVTRPSRPATSTATVRGSWDGGDRGNLSISGTRSANGLTLAGDLGWRRHIGETEMEMSRVRDGATPAATVAEDRRFDGPNQVDMLNGRVSADYDLNARDRISGELSFRDMDGGANGLERFSRADGTGVVSDRYERRMLTDFGNSGVSARGSWRRKFSGDQHELVADLRYDRSESDQLSRAWADTLVGAIPSYVERSGSSNTRDAYAFKIDYTRPFADGQRLRTGYEVERSVNDFDSFRLRGPTESAMTPVPGQADRFEYDQTIHAAYATYDRSFGSLDVQGGLRVEQVDFTINQVTGGASTERDYLRAYPTVHLSYALTDSQRLRGSYSRRIARPSPQDLNPHVLYVDPQNLRSGNPNLDPEITDSFELSWQLRAGGTFYALTGFYRDSSGGVTDVVQDLGGGVVLTTRENIGESERMGVEFIANGRLGSQWTYNASGALYHNEIRTPGLPGAGVQSGTTGMARASLNWQPTTLDFFQLNGFWMGEQIQAQGRRDDFGMLNIGYRRKLSDDFSLVFTGTNILDSAEQNVTVDSGTFRDRTFIRFAEPTYYIGFTWSLGGAQGRRPEPAFDFSTPTGPG